MPWISNQQEGPLGTCGWASNATDKEIELRKKCPGHHYEPAHNCSVCGDFIDEFPKLIWIEDSELEKIGKD